MDRRRPGAGGGFEVKRTAKFRVNPLPRTRYCDLDDGSVPELGGSRPDRFFAVSGPQERVQRHIVEQMADSAPVLPMLDAPVPLVEQPVKVLKILDNSLPDVEQVIGVPKIILHQVPQRAVPRERQLAEQLVGRACALVPPVHAHGRLPRRRWPQVVPAHGA